MFAQQLTIDFPQPDSELIESWLSGRSKSTVDHYRRAVVKFMRWIKKPLAWASILDVQQWLDSLDLSFSSRRCYLYSLRSLFKWMEKAGKVEKNPAALVSLPQPQQDISERITTPEKIKEAIATESNNRDKLIMECLYYLGLRVSELCQLKWGDLSDGVLRVRGKRNKVRHLKVPDLLRDKLEKLRGDEKVPIFPSRTGRHLDRHRVGKIIKAAGKRIGLPELSPHWFRHCHATHALANGAPLPLLQKNLGHSDIRITAIYLHVNPNVGSGDYL